MITLDKFYQRFFNKVHNTKHLNAERNTIDFFIKHLDIYNKEIYK